MSGFVVQGSKSDDHDSSRLKNGLYPICIALIDVQLIVYYTAPTKN